LNIEDCLEEGLLKRVPPNKDKAIKSLEKSKHLLELAESELNSGFYESAIVSAYMSVFHAARAILFRDGFKERSHYALYVYISEKYEGKMEKWLINELNALRLQRHELMYDIEKSVEVLEEDANTALNIAKEFLRSVKKILNF